MNIITYYTSLPPLVRIIIIILVAVIAHFVIKGIKKLVKSILSPETVKGVTVEVNLIKRYPKLASLTTIFVSGITFFIYFLAIGLILKQFNVSLGTYLASASIIGLAIAFGSQGFVQDVVMGLTLIFTNALNNDEMVELSGQVGRVESIGLRFTTLINLQGQKILIPNRSIGVIGQFKNGHIPVFVDIQIPQNANPEEIKKNVNEIAEGLFNQYKSIILKKPRILGIKEASNGSWTYLRIKFELWPGQNSIIETTFKQRVIFSIKSSFPDYADWMISIVYRAEYKFLN